MKFELDHRTGMMRPKKDEEIYFAQSQGGGLIVDDKKNNIKYVIQRDGRITKLFGSFDKDNLNLYDMRDARIIADRVRRLLGVDHKYTDFHYFLRGYHMSESFIKTCSDFLGESIWSDIQDRSSGETIRKEDDVNHMNFDTFAEYIKDNYSEKGDWFAVGESEDGKSRSIEIDIIYGKEIDLCFNVVEGEIYNILVKGNKNYVDIPGLKKIFNVNILGSSSFSVYEKNWTISNNTFVKLIEFFLKKKTNESIWSDIQDRSSGETVRKEDDVDRFGYEDFFVYLTEHYKPKSKKINEEIGGRTSIVDTDIIEIFIPIESIDGRIKTLIIEMSKKDNSVVSMATSPTLFDKYVNLERMLNNRYTLTTSRLSSRIYLKPKKKPTNRTIVDLIDTFLVVVDNPILEKVS
jgi:hypothetical protein